MKLVIGIMLVLAAITGTAYSQSAEKMLMELYNNQEFDAAAKHIPDAMNEKPKDFDLLMLCGDIYFELENLDGAMSAYQRAYKVDDKPVVMRKIGRIMSMQGNHLEAIKYLRKTVDEDKKDLYSYLELAQAFIRADSLTQAELAITRAREIDRKNPASFIAMGDYYFKQRVYELAKDNYEEALSMDESNVEAREKLAISYYWLANRESDSDLRNAQFFRSLEEWNKITKQDPKNARAFFEQGRIFYFSNQLGKAAVSLMEYVRLRPSSMLGRWYLAQALSELNQCDSAISHLRVVADNVDSVKIKAKLMLARCYTSIENYSEAVNTYEEIKSDTALSSSNLQFMGNAALLSGDTVKAIAAWREAIELDPANSCRLMYILGTQLNRMKDYDGAVHILQKRLDTQECRDSLDPVVYYFIGTSYLFNAKPDLAKPALEKSIELDPSFLFAHIYLGDALAALSDATGAEKSFQYVIDNGTADPEKNKSALNQAYSKLCGMKLDQKKYADLIKISRVWTDLYPDLPYPPLYLAVGYQGAGDTANACKFYKRVLQLDPKNAPARKNKDALGCE